MAPRLNVSSLVIQRLLKLEENASGQLLGVLFSDKSICVLGISNQESSPGDIDDTKNDSIISSLPANINICGFFEIVSEEETEKQVENSLFENFQGSKVALSVDFTSKKINAFVYEENIIKKVEHAVIDDLNRSFLYLRLSAEIPISCELNCESVKEAFSFIHQKASNGLAAFQIKDSNVYILGDSQSDINGISPEVAVEKILSSANQSEEKKHNNIAVLNVDLFLRGTNDETSPQLAPVIKYVKKIHKHADIQLALDALTFISKKMEIKNLYPVLVESICRNLDLNEKCILAQLKSDEVKEISPLETFHFLPPPCGHFLTIVYPTKQTCEQLKNSREIFHGKLLLPTDKPLFRRANAFDFTLSNMKQSSSLLVNPHEGLPGSGVPEGDPCFVLGTYAYHHYMQDKIDDSGWGCAYRSLQTIFSWFRFQGYTNKPVPTHKEIQQCLVSMGDKPASFVGSRQWIGSTEVGFVLDALLGVTCRIVNVSSGEELTMKGGELSYHFKTQGTPVMIGGGVLAHTIIGVDYNRKTGEIKFLILDPHYTGEENLKIIQSKGWCGWKGPEFWKKDAFYNMCLPLTPKCV